jgi:two-component system, cell cycle sensor histidine kinase PleC
LASRASQGAGALTQGGSRDEGSESVFSVTLRIVVLSALLLLAVNAVIAARQLKAPAAADASALSLHLDAERLASRAGDVARTLRVSAEAGAQRLEQTSSTPQNAVQTALRLAAPAGTSAAVVGDGVVLATSGGAGVVWRRIEPIGGTDPGGTWLGQAMGEGANGGTRKLYAVAQNSAGRHAVQVVVAADLAPLLRIGTEGVAARGASLLLSSDGVVLAAAGAPPDGGATARTLLGLSVADLRHAAATPGGAQGRLGPQRRARIAVAESADGALLAVTAVPEGLLAQADRGRLATSVFTLFAPLIIGLSLTLALMIMTRRAKAARDAQRDSERKFRLAIEGARCGIWEWDLKADQVAMSDITGVMLGWGGGGIARGEDVMARIAQEHHERVREALQNGAAFGGVDVSFSVPRPSGGVSWIDIRGQAIGRLEGQAYSRLIGVALDVTDERIAEQRAQAAEHRLHDAIDSVSEAFVLWDRSGRLLMCNQNFREFFALEARMAPPGAQRSEVLKLAELAVRSHMPAAHPARPGQREVEMSDGRWLQVSERRTAEGGLVMTAADITHIKRQEEARRLNEEALQNAIERLEESRQELRELAQKYQAEKHRAEAANSAKSEFLANMSHELRTPLNAINGFSEIMATEMFGVLGDRRYKEYANDILSSGQHLLALINDILDMSKIEAGKMNLSFEPLELEDLVSEAVRLMRNRAEAAKLRMEVDIPADLPMVQADYRAVKQVLLNLLSNAVKFTPQGGRIVVAAREADGPTGRRVRVSVTDSGIGIAPQDLARLARPFEQVETQHAKTQQGTGLGLALTKSLIELHDGVFTMESKPGVGTTVIFTLPIQQADPARARVVPEAALALEPVGF